MIANHTYNRLCQQVQEGDAQCIAELYDLYGDALFGVIIRIVKSEEVASEILQDTFTKIWQKGHTFNPNMGRLYTWMLRIARNASLNHIQSKNSRQAKNIQGDDNLVYLSDHSKAAKKMESVDLKGAINKLEKKYRDVIDLIYFQGYTHVEASETLGLPLGTIKSRIKIALRELKKIYDFRFSSAIGIIALFFTLSI